MLLRFINKLLNDNEMYKGSGSRDGGGALYNFYEEYFGLKLDDGKFNQTQAEKTGGEIIRTVAGNITTEKCQWSEIASINLEKKDLFDLFQKEPTKYKGLAIKFKVKTDKATRDYYAVVDDFLTQKPNMAVIIFSTKGFPFAPGKLTITGESITSPDNVYYGYISDNFERGQKSKIKYIDLEDASDANVSLKTIEYEITDVKILVKSGEKEPYLEMSRRFSGRHASLDSKKPLAITKFKAERSKG
jgi:hypothetical protein